MRGARSEGRESARALVGVCTMALDCLRWLDGALEVEFGLFGPRRGAGWLCCRIFARSVALLQHTVASAPESIPKFKSTRSLLMTACLDVQKQTATRGTSSPISTQLLYKPPLHFLIMSV